MLVGWANATVTYRTVLHGKISPIIFLIALLTVIGLRSRQLSGNLSALDAEQRALVDNPLAGILFTEGRRILRNFLEM